MKIRASLRKLDLWLRPPHVREEDKGSAVETIAVTGPHYNPGGAQAPTNWVPSQQDERPKY